MVDIYIDDKMELVWYIRIVLPSLLSIGVIGNTKIRTTSLVNPVPEGGILSVLCQVWNLEHGEKVIITRQVATHSEILAWNKVILSTGEDRIFLAERQKNDGSMVQFMTLMNVVKSDQGKYSCEVMKLEAGKRPKVIVWDSVQIAVEYFPSEIYPICSPGEPLILQSGCNISFKCSSEKASPTVSMTWTKSGVNINGNADVLEFDSHVFSVLNVNITEKDDGAVYVCSIYSSAFYNRVQSCHIGPISVISNDSSLGNVNTPEHDSQLNQNWGQTNQSVDYQICREVCPTYPTSYLYFIISTIIAVLLGMIFFSLFIILLIRYCRMQSATRISTTSKSEMVPLNRNLDEIYADIDGIRAPNNRVYMTLETPQNQSGHYEGHYKIRYAGIYKPHYV